MDVGFAQLLFRLGLDTEQALDDYVVDFSPHVSGIDAKLLQMLAEGRHAPLKATVALCCILILHKSFILLIDRIVGQMGVLGFLARQV